MPQTPVHAARRCRSALVLAPILVLLAGCATTREDTHTARRVTFENDEVQVVEASYPKGGSTPMHTYLWPHVVYVVEGGTVQATASDGSVSTLELRPGQTLWRGVRTYAIRNVGPTTVRIVEVAVKNASTAPRPAETFPAR